MRKTRKLTIVGLIVLASFLVALVPASGANSYPVGESVGQALAQEAETDETTGSAYFGAVAGQVYQGVAQAAYGAAGALVAVWRSEVGVVWPAGKEGPDNDEAMIFPPPRPRAPGQFVRWATADDSGSYRIDELPPGTYYIEAAAGQEAAAWFKPAFGGTIQIAAGKVTKKNLTLNGPFGALGGKVTTSDGTGVPGATMLALPKTKPGETAKLEGGAEITAEADGSLILRQGEASLQLKAGAQGKGAGNLTLNQEVAGFLERLTLYRTKTDADGYYFLPFVRPGTYWVIAIKGNAYAYQEAEIKASAFTRADLQLPAFVILEPEKPGAPTDQQEPPGPGREPPGQQKKNGLPVKIKVFIRGQLITPDVEPVLEGDRILVPLRALAEALGAEVSWDAQGTVAVKKNGVTVKLQINGQVAYQNEQSISLDVPARLSHGRTLVPVRFLSQALGAKVKWDAGAGSVFVE